jgi:ribosomal protein S12 methylthiotransferase
VDELVELMAEGVILPYLDVPLQHASPAILKAMRRPGNIENTLQRIEQWRTTCPELTLRSTFIVGFPGETNDDFEQLLSFIEEARLDRVGAFAYSPVEGAAANALANAVPEDLKEERLERFMELQAAISADKLQDKVGRTLTVLVDEVGEDEAYGRSSADAPEIDGMVIIENGADLRPGQFVEVEITAAGEHDLFGEVMPG